MSDNIGQHSDGTILRGHNFDCVQILAVLQKFLHRAGLKRQLKLVFGFIANNILMRKVLVEVLICWLRQIGDEFPVDFALADIAVELGRWVPDSIVLLNEFKGRLETKRLHENRIFIVPRIKLNLQVWSIFLHLLLLESTILLKALVLCYQWANRVQEPPYWRIIIGILRITKLGDFSTQICIKIDRKANPRVQFIDKEKVFILVKKCLVFRREIRNPLCQVISEIIFWFPKLCEKVRIMTLLLGVHHV